MFCTQAWLWCSHRRLWLKCCSNTSYHRNFSLKNMFYKHPVELLYNQHQTRQKPSNKWCFRCYQFPKTKFCNLSAWLWCSLRHPWLKCCSNTLCRQSWPLLNKFCTQPVWLWCSLRQTPPKHPSSRLLLYRHWQTGYPKTTSCNLSASWWLHPLPLAAGYNTTLYRLYQPLSCICSSCFC